MTKRTMTGFDTIEIVADADGIGLIQEDQNHTPGAWLPREQVPALIKHLRDLLAEGGGDAA